MRSILLIFLVISLGVNAQVNDTLTTGKDSGLSNLMDQVKITPATVYAHATFKTTRLINGHSVQSLGAHVLDIKISHRFGPVNGGFYEFFGLDQATTRIGADYGITDQLMIGAGHSSYEKLYDGFAKYRILRQSKGARSMPITLSALGSIYITSVKFLDTSIKNTFANRTSYAGQLLIARKFSEGFSLQLMPSWVHYNLVPNPNDPHDLFAIGIGGRQKLSKRVSFNVEYYYRFPATTFGGTYNPLSVGFDIETGGHVFQIMFTNSTGMAENQYLGNTTGKWSSGDIHLGFNISRVFTLGGKKKQGA